MLAPLRPSSAPALIALWNRRWGELFPLDEALWNQQALGDPQVFQTELLQGLDKGALVGAVGLKTSLQDPSRGWISFLLVEPGQESRMGRQLLQQALETLRRAGATHVRYGGDPRHFFPGVPQADTALAELLEDFGFRRGGCLEQDLILELSEFHPPASVRTTLEASGLAIAPCGPEKVGALLEFLSGSFPGRWLYETQVRLRAEPVPADILLLHEANRVWGFCHLYHEGSKWFGPSIYWRKAIGAGYGGLGPIGISEALRGRGLGFALLCYGVQQLKDMGVRRMVVDWTSRVDFYERIGFKPWRSYCSYTREL